MFAVLTVPKIVNQRFSQQARAGGRISRASLAASQRVGLEYQQPTALLDRIEKKYHRNIVFNDGERIGTKEFFTASPKICLQAMADSARDQAGFELYRIKSNSIIQYDRGSLPDLKVFRSDVFTD